MTRSRAAFAPLFIVVFALTGCGRIKSTQTVELSLTQAASPAPGIEVRMYIPSPSVDPFCDGEAIRFLDGENHRVTDAQGHIVWRREITMSTGKRGSRTTENNLTLCARFANEQRVLMRSFDTTPHRRLEITCDLDRPPATRDSAAGACETRIPWQLDDTLALPNVGLALLLFIRAFTSKRAFPGVVGVGVLAGFLGIPLGAALHRFSIVSQAYSAIYLVAILWLHVVLTLARREPKET